MKRVAIVGAGIGGLAVAHALLKQAHRDRRLDVVVLERAPRAGGNIRTESIDGFLCEWGPNGFLDNAPATLDLVRDIGLAPRLQPSDDRARRRYVFRYGALHPLPGGPIDFARSGLLSWPGKLRLAAEPFARRRPDGDETIHAFAARRIGAEAADVLIDAMVSGVFAGDARALSLHACFPAMWQMEDAHGGLFRALLARRRRGGRRDGEAIGSPLGRLTSFRGGAEELVRGLVGALGTALRTGTEVQGMARVGNRYRLAVTGGAAVDADAVVFAAGPATTARIVRDIDVPLAETLEGLSQAAPIAVICLGYRADRLPRPLDGFGFLVPRSEGVRTLGVLWDSSIYPGRAPEGSVLLRAMIGGATDPGAATLDDAQLLDVVRKDLRTTMGLDAMPELVRIIRHHAGIPQYTVGHLDRLRLAEQRLAALPGLALAGNGYRGVSINTCIADAIPLADRLLAGR